MRTIKSYFGLRFSHARASRREEARERYIFYLCSPITCNFNLYLRSETWVKEAHYTRRLCGGRFSFRPDYTRVVRVLELGAGIELRQGVTAAE